MDINHTATKHMTTTPRTISMAKSLAFFVISLVINSVGNVLTLVTSTKIHPGFLGSAYWTAATANFANAINFNLFWAFLSVGILTIILNAILMGHFSWKKTLGNIAFMLPFSALIQFFSDFFLGAYPQVFAGLPDARTPGMIALYIILNFVGVGCIGVAISIYQRVNLVLHPADDLMQILRFKYFGGHAAQAMWASYIPPIILAVIALVITRSFTNFGLGTIFAFLFQGGITGFADKWVFPTLKHQAIETN